MELEREDRRVELVVLKNKLVLLIESFDYFINSIHKENPKAASWLEVLDKFSILAAKYSTLIEDIGSAATLRNSSLLSRVVVLPGSDSTLDQQTLLHQRISVLLRTKLTPRLEEAEALIYSKLKHHSAATTSISNPNPQSELGFPASLPQQLKHWKNLIEIQDMLSLSSSQLFSQLNEERLATANSAKKTNANTSSDTKTSSHLFSEPHPGAPTEVALEHLIQYISSGTRS